MSEELAQLANHYVRGWMAFGADNQGYGQLQPSTQRTPEFLMRRMQATGAIGSLKQQMPPRGSDLRTLIAYGHEVQKAKAGNCFEQSCVALVYLTGQRLAALDVVMLEGEGDHAFVVIDPPGKTGAYYPDAFTDWGSAVICDPWAGLACQASAYAGLWQTTMADWNRRGLEIGGVGSGWIKPTRSSWANSVQECRKRSYTTA